MTKAQHLDGALVPKRILALDGGGIRGVLTLEYLGVIEAMLGIFAYLPEKVYSSLASYH